MVNEKVIKTRNNTALIDGQNLYISTMTKGWEVDLYKFRIWLAEKYGVSDAYYFIGYTIEKH